jgi:hypothetical protein
MDFSLQNHTMIPPAIPLAGGEGDDVHSYTLGPMLEVVAANGGCPLSGRAHQMEEPEQAHQWPHAEIYLTEVDEDHHPCDGVQ